MLELTLNSWVFADPHYNHRKLVEHGYRPDGYEAMISKSWAENVQPNDIVYCLCDVCFSRQRYKILLRGNHDQQKDSWYLSHGWNEIYETLLVQHEQKRILLSHIPQLDDGSWDLNLHGHLHDDQHRAKTPEMQAILGTKHRLFSIEWTDYKLVNTVEFISRPKYWMYLLDKSPKS